MGGSDNASDAAGIDLALDTCVVLAGATFPMQFEPTNFFEMRMGSQFRSLLKKVRRVVPSVNGSKPACTGCTWAMGLRVLCVSACGS